MSDRSDAIRKHTSDQLALVKHILEAVERQRGNEAVRLNLDANQIIIEMERVLKEQASALETMAGEYGSDFESAVKKAVTEVLGLAAGLYDQIREQPVSRMLRDDYTALSLAAMGYTAYHTFGLVINDDKIAHFAINKLKEITPLLVRISQVLPMVVAQETAQDQGFTLDRGIGEQAVSNTQEAWSNSVTHRV